MIIVEGVAARKRMKVPAISRTMLVLAVQRSFEVVLLFENARYVMSGKTTVNSAMLTAARSDNSSPA